MNARMEPFLPVFVNHQQDYRVECLPMAEFAENNGLLETTKYTPFLPPQELTIRLLSLMSMKRVRINHVFV